MPGLCTGVATTDGDNLEITVSAEMYQAGGSVWFRALVDGEVAEPSDVMFKSGSVNFDGVRCFTFIKQNVTAGQHLVEFSGGPEPPQALGTGHSRSTPGRLCRTRPPRSGCCSKRSVD